MASVGISINFVKMLVYDLAAKQQNSFPSPQDFDNYANLSQNDLYNFYNDEREKMLLKVKAGQTLFMPSPLTTFMVYQEPYTSASGYFTAPSGYIYDQALTTAGDIVITKTDSERLPSYLNSTIDMPTVDDPIYVELPNNSFQVYPNNVNLPLKFTYLRRPNDVHWGYTLVNNRPVYDPNTTVDFEWQTTELLRLVSRILKYMGVSIADEVLAQQAQLMTQQAS